jgi:hypothetical protein
MGMIPLTREQQLTVLAVIDVDPRLVEDGSVELHTTPGDQTKAIVRYRVIGTFDAARLAAFLGPASATPASGSTRSPLPAEVAPDEAHGVSEAGS